MVAIDHELLGDGVLGDEVGEPKHEPMSEEGSVTRHFPAMLGVGLWVHIRVQGAGLQGFQRSAHRVLPAGRHARHPLLFISARIQSQPAVKSPFFFCSGLRRRLP